ncbi:MAG: ScpA family protein [Pseudomonadota bacterium]
MIDEAQTLGGDNASAPMTEMDTPAADPNAWDTAPISIGDDDDVLRVDVSGFEGPLDLLLAMARTQKVDLSQISVVELADQYLAFVAETRRLQLALAADYLVMAAWLTFLKSRLILPKEDEDDGNVPAEELARQLAFRLMRLDAMRNASAQLMTRKRLGRDVFARGMPEAVRTVRDTTFTATLNDLLRAYADQRNRTVKQRSHVVRARTVWSIKHARAQLERLVGPLKTDWMQLDLCLEAYLPSREARRTALASSFGASLEMAREGIVELKQDAAFAPLFVRGRPADDDDELREDADAAEVSAKETVTE